MRTLTVFAHAFLRLGPAALIIAVTAPAPVRSEESAPPDVRPPVVDAQRTAELERLLSHATLVGHFTVTGDEKREGNDAKLTAERYELGEVKHLGSNQWLIQSRIKYGDHDVTVPLTLPIRWAGDTPMICLDNLAIPGLGTFTARVMIYKGHYAGFWSGADHGGHLFGVIEHGEKQAADQQPGSSAEPQPQPKAD